MVSGSWWKISENWDRGSTQNFAARLMSIVVCSGEPLLTKMTKIKKSTLFENGDVLKFQKCQFSKNTSPCGSFPPRLYLIYIMPICVFQGLEMAWDPIFPGSRVTRMSWDPVFLRVQVLKMVRVPVFPGLQDTRLDCVQVFPGSQDTKMVRVPVFPGS